MKHVRFDGVGRLLAFGHELFGGDTVEMTNDQAAQLEADPHVPVTVTDGRELEAHEGEGHPDTPNDKENV